MFLKQTDSNISCTDQTPENTNTITLVKSQSKGAPKLIAVGCWGYVGYLRPSNCLRCCSNKPSRWSALVTAAWYCCFSCCTTSSFFSIACFTLSINANDRTFNAWTIGTNQTWDYVRSVVWIMVVGTVRTKVIACYQTNKIPQYQIILL